MEKISIKELKQKDISDVIKLSLRIFNSTGEDTYHNEKIWKEYLENGGLLLGAYMDTQLAGYKFGYRVDSNEFHSWMGGVDDKFRGLGLATILMNYQENWARKNNFKIISVNTYKDKYPVMHAFLTAHGYEVIKNEEKVDEGITYTKIFFAKAL